MKIVLMGLLFFSPVAFAHSADKSVVLKLLIDHQNLHPLDLTGHPLRSTVGDELAKALSLENITVEGYCEVDPVTIHEKCALEISSRATNGLRAGYEFSFEKAQNIIINDQVNFIGAL